MRPWAFWLLTASLIIGVVRVAPCADPPKLSDTAVEGALHEYEKLAEKYKIEILTLVPKFPQDGSITGQPADRQKVATFLALFKNEWDFYPVELMEPCGLKRVTLCENLFSMGRSLGGVAWNEELYLDVGDSRHSKLFVRALIHHEFFHIVDRHMHLKLDVRNGLPDPVWEALNPPGFKYDWANSGPSTKVLDFSQKGFLSKYSQTAVQEDKAELYSFMVTMGQIVDDRAKIDPILDAKAKRMKTLLKAFCPQMDDEFWKAARKVSRPGG